MNMSNEIPPRHGCIPLQMFKIIVMFQTYDPYIHNDTIIEYHIYIYTYTYIYIFGASYMYPSIWLYPDYLPLEQNSNLPLFPRIL